jgi:hypothetical protein
MPERAPRASVRNSAPAARHVRQHLAQLRLVLPVQRVGVLRRGIIACCHRIAAIGSMRERQYEFVLVIDDRHAVPRRKRSAPYVFLRYCDSAHNGAARIYMRSARGLLIFGGA